MGIAVVVAAEEEIVDSRLVVEDQVEILAVLAVIVQIEQQLNVAVLFGRIQGQGHLGRWPQRAGAIG